MRRFLTRRNIIIVIVLVLAVGWWMRRGQNKNGVEVRTAEVTRGEVISSITVSGEIKADISAVLNYPTAGKLGWIGVKEGDVVTKGKLLAGLDSRDLAAAQVAAYYKYLAADANAKEIEDSVKGHDKDETFVQKNDRVAAQTARDAAYDAWKTAMRAEGNANLVAPMAGKVIEVTAKAVGDTVGVTDGITIVDPVSLYLEIELDETDLGQLREKQEVKVKLDAFEGKELSGVISEIGFVARSSDTGATVFPAKVKFSDMEILEKLRIGMNGDCKIELAKVENVLRLPVEAVVDGEVKLTDKKAEPKKVETGLEGNQYVEVKSGLNEGEKVVVE